MTLARTHQGEIASSATTVGDEIASADRVFARMEAQFEELVARRKALEALYPWLIDAQNRPDPVPKGVIGAYEGTLRELGDLRKDMLGWPKLRQSTLKEQLATRQLSGQLILASTVAVFIVQIVTRARKYVQPQYAAAFEQEAKAIYDEFIRANPGAQFAEGGRLSNQT